MDDIQNNNKDTKQVKPKHNRNKIAVIGLAIVLVLVIGVATVLYQKQSHKIKNLDTKTADLNTSVAKLNSEKDDLANKNANLSKVVKGYTEQTDSTKSETSKSTTSNTSTDNDTSTNDTTAAPTTATLEVTSIKDLTPAYFGSTNPQANAKTIRIVFFTIKNLTSSTQTYTSNQFTAVSDTGTILKSLLYASPTTGTPWSSATVAPGGSASGYVSFDPTTIVALGWDSGAGDGALDATLPTVE